MLKHRLVYGGVLLSVFVGVVTLDIRSGGATGTSVLIAAFALAALFEFYDLVRRGGRGVAPLPGLVLAGVMLSASLLVDFFGSVREAGTLSLALGSGCVIAALAWVFLAGSGRRSSGREPFPAAFEEMATTSFGLAYVALPAACYLAVLRTDQGLPWFFFAVLVTFTLLVFLKKKN